MFYSIINSYMTSIHTSCNRFNCFFRCINTFIQTVFTKKQITISNPGVYLVAGSFAEVVNEFFNNYLTVGLLQSSGILNKLQVPKEYSQYFAQGANGGGRNVGKAAGKKYYSIGGAEIQ